MDYCGSLNSENCILGTVPVHIATFMDNPPIMINSGSHYECTC